MKADNVVQPANLPKLLICPYCSKDIPEISLEGPNRDITCKIKCSCMKDERVIYLQSFLKDISRKNICTNKCAKHHNRKSIQYCIECSSWLCKECLKFHFPSITSDTHLIINHELILKCNEHHQKFISYCKSCHMNICPECISSHHNNDTHSLIQLFPIDSKIFSEYLNQTKEIISKNKKQYKELLNKIIARSSTNWELNIMQKNTLPSTFEINNTQNKLLKAIISLIHSTLLLFKDYPSYQLLKLSQVIQFNYSEPETDESLLKETNMYYQYLSNNRIIKLDNIYHYSCSLFDESMKRDNLICLQNGLIAYVSSNSKETFHHIEIWNIKSLEHIGTLKGHEQSIKDLIELTDGKLASCSYDKTIRLWDFNTLNCITVIKADKECSEMIILDNNQLGVCLSDSTVLIYDSLSFKCLAVFPEKDDWKPFAIKTLYKLKDGRLCVIISKVFKIYDCKTAKCLASLEGHRYSPRIIIELSEDDNMIASCCQEKEIRLYDIKSYKFIRELIGHTAFINTLLYLNNGQLISGSSDKTIRIWQKKTFDCVAILHGHTHSIVKCIMLKSGLLASCSNDSYIMIWNLQNMKCVCALCGHKNVIDNVFEYDDGRLISKSWDNLITLWNKN